MSVFEAPTSFKNGNPFPVVQYKIHEDGQPYRTEVLYNGKALVVWVLTPDELDSLPDGTLLHSIAGREVIKGEGYIDNDTRGGYLAYGLTEDQFN